MRGGGAPKEAGREVSSFGILGQCRYAVTLSIHLPSLVQERQGLVNHIILDYAGLKLTGVAYKSRYNLKQQKVFAVSGKCMMWMRSN